MVPSPYNHGPGKEMWAEFGSLKDGLTQAHFPPISLSIFKVSGPQPEKKMKEKQTRTKIDFSKSLESSSTGKRERERIDEGEKIPVDPCFLCVSAAGFCLLRRSLRVHRELGGVAELGWFVERSDLHLLGFSLSLLFPRLRPHRPRWGPTCLRA